MIKSQIKKIASSFFEEIKFVREYLHQYPELSFKEYETSKYIQSKLDEWGIDYTNNWVETGIVVLIEGNNPSSKTIALRADIDGLPILEENDVPYKSKNEGVMHACGHDVHTACLLGAIKILNELKDSFSGTIKCIFQPGEELNPGGASLMIKEGVLESPKVDLITAQHVFPELEAGKVGFKKGMYMASTDELYLTVHGKGGHGAMPHKLIDPIIISAHILLAMQQINSRNNDPTIPSVISFGRIEGLGATNVIPDKVEIQGTFRTMDETWRNKAHELMKSVAENVAESMGGKADFRVSHGYPYLENDEKLTDFNIIHARGFLGDDNVVELPLRMTGEDFAFYSQTVTSSFYRLGVRNEDKNITAAVHNSKFDADEKSIETGMGLMAYLAYKQLMEYEL